MVVDLWTWSTPNPNCAQFLDNLIWQLCLNSEDPQLLDLNELGSTILFLNALNPSKPYSKLAKFSKLTKQKNRALVSAQI